MGFKKVAINKMSIEAMLHMSRQKFLHWDEL